MIVDAVECLGDSLDLSLIGIKKVPGGSVTESQLVRGVAFKRTFSYAGFEQQPKSFSSPKILLLNLELELKSEKENAEVRLDDVETYQSIVDAEWSIIYEKLAACADSGAQIILSKLPIGDLATQYFADRGLFCAGRVAREDLERVARATGGRVQTTVNGLTAEVLGSCERFEEVQLGAERYNIFTGFPGAMRTATLILRGGAEQVRLSVPVGHLSLCGTRSACEGSVQGMRASDLVYELPAPLSNCAFLQFIDETERSVHDAIMIVKSSIRGLTRVVAGGGAAELNISKHLKSYSLTVDGKQQLVIAAFGRAMELIPRTLADNAGFDSTDILNRLRQKHATHSGAEPCWWGVDIDKEGICDTFERGVWEPVTSKINSFASATEAACLVLSVDETVRNPKSQQPEGGPAGRGGGMGGGKPMSAALGGAGMRGMMGAGKGVRVMQGKGGK